MNGIFATIRASRNAATSAAVPDLRLHGWSLRLARVIWLGIATCDLAVFLVSIPAYYVQLSMLCTDPRQGCVFGQLTLSSAQALHHLGLALGDYAAYTLTLDLIVSIVLLAVGVLIFRYKSDAFIGLFASLLLITFGSFGISDGRVSAFSALVPHPWAVDLVVSIITIASWPALGIFLYVFPNGRFVPRWAWIFVLLWVFQLVVYSVPPNFPLFIENWPSLLQLAEKALTYGSAVGVLIYRYLRRSDQLQRQQIKWLVFGFSAAVLFAILFGSLGTLLPALSRSDSIYQLVGATLPGAVIFFSIPLSIGIAILRYRLWDIDVLIKRTLVYGLLTACVIGIYVLVVGSLGTLFQTRGNLVISLLATGLIAVLFHPLSDRLQRGVNRLLYGQRDEPHAVLSRLSQRLEATFVPNAVLPTIVETVAQALKLPYVAILLKQEDAFTLAASYGKPIGEPLTLPLVYQAECIGQLLLAPRTPGEAFTPADRRLLDELAHQAGLATHAVRLASDLQHARERLILAREEERRRLRRDLHDGIGPTLASLSQRLDTACHLVPRDPDAAVTELRTLKERVRSTIADIRRLVYALRPPVLDEFGLISAIREHALHGQGPEHLDIVIEAPDDLPPLPAAVEVAAYRIVLEALTNTERHAQAQNCLVHLQLTGTRALCLDIVDDGCGLPNDYHAGVRITSMRERAAELGGECTITVRPTGGTHVQVRLPLPKE